MSMLRCKHCLILSVVHEFKWMLLIVLPFQDLKISVKMITFSYVFLRNTMSEVNKFYGIRKLVLLACFITVHKNFKLKLLIKNMNVNGGQNLRNVSDQKWKSFDFEMYYFVIHEEISFLITTL